MKILLLSLLLIFPVLSNAAALSCTGMTKPVTGVVEYITANNMFVFRDEDDNRVFGALGACLLIVSEGDELWTPK